MPRRRSSKTTRNLPPELLGDALMMAAPLPPNAKFLAAARMARIGPKTAKAHNLARIARADRAMAQTAKKIKARKKAEAIRRQVAKENADLGL